MTSTPPASSAAAHVGAAPPPRADDPEALAGLREDLQESGYDLTGVQRALGARAAAALHREQLLPALRATQDLRDPAGVLARLLVLGATLPVAEVDRCLPRTGASGLVRLGLAREEGDGVRATCDLRPYGTGEEQWWVASDLGETVTGGPLRPDHVLGIGGASTTLASWTPRPRVERALDLGTGCGVQTLHLAGHTAYRVATDLSARALAFARFTLALNGVGADLREGDLLAPVAGEEFDLVVSNPPFVITPRRAHVPVLEYRDGGRGGDTLVAGLIAQVGARLRPGGIAQLLGNWELGAGEDWRERVGGWLAGTGLDAWVVQREEQDVAEYAETWVRDGGQRPGTSGFDELYAAWLDDFAARGVERVGFGVVTLQRPATDREPWRDLTDLRSPVSQPMGPTVLRGLRARNWLAEHTEDELLDVAWSVATDVTEERVGRPGAADPQVIQLRQGGGLGRVVRLDTLGAGLVGALDGELTARQLCAGLAVLTEAPAAEVEQHVLPLLRELVADGLLV